MLSGGSEPAGYPKDGNSVTEQKDKRNLVADDCGVATPAPNGLFLLFYVKKNSPPWLGPCHQQQNVIPNSYTWAPVLACHDMPGLVFQLCL